MVAKVKIENARRGASGYIVARVWNCKLWFYGAYESEDRAEEVAKEVDGIVTEYYEESEE